MVFKPFGLVKGMVFEPFGLVKGMAFKSYSRSGIGSSNNRKLV